MAKNKKKTIIIIEYNVLRFIVLKFNTINSDAKYRKQNITQIHFFEVLVNSKPISKYVTDSISRIVFKLRMISESMDRATANLVSSQHTAV